MQSEITGPLAVLSGAVHQRISGNGEFAVLFDDARCAQMLRGVFEAYYDHVAPERIVFDTNRSWTGRAALVSALYPQSKIICCVRGIGWIIDSLERIRAKHPLKLSKLFASQTIDSSSVYTRVDALMNSETGLIGAAWSTLREAWFSEAAQRLVVIPYDVLVRQPEKTLRGLYLQIGEPYFDHDFANVFYEAPEYDENLGMPGLHTVRRVVEYQERQPVIPPDVFAKYAKTHFWETPDLNPRRVTVL